MGGPHRVQTGVPEKDSQKDLGKMTFATATSDAQVSAFETAHVCNASRARAPVADQSEGDRHGAVVAEEIGLLPGRCPGARPLMKPLWPTQATAEEGHGSRPVPAACARDAEDPEEDVADKEEQRGRSGEKTLRDNRPRQGTKKARGKKTPAARTPARTEKTQSEPQPEPQSPKSPRSQKTLVNPKSASLKWKIPKGHLLPYSTRPCQTCRVNARQLTRDTRLETQQNAVGRKVLVATLWYMTAACSAAPAEIGLRTHDPELGQAREDPKQSRSDSRALRGGPAGPLSLTMADLHGSVDRARRQARPADPSPVKEESNPFEARGRADRATCPRWQQVLHGSDEPGMSGTRAPDGNPH